MRKVGNRPVPPEECAKRLSDFLSRKPRHPKTVAYLNTLPKRQKVTITPKDFEVSREVARGVIAKAEALSKHDAVALVSVEARKARLRPRARGGRTKMVSQWTCRPTALRQIDGVGVGRTPRDQLEVNRQRKVLFDAQGGICGLCGKPLEPEHHRGSIDHVIPRFLGGQDRLGNLLLAHGECNGRKSNDAPTGCECVTLLAINAKLGVEPMFWSRPEITRLSEGSLS